MSELPTYLAAFAEIADDGQIYAPRAYQVPFDVQRSFHETLRHNGEDWFLDKEKDLGPREARYFRRDDLARIRA